MTLELRWTDYAEENLDLYKKYSKKTTYNLKKYIQSLKQIINFLPESPYLGKIFFQVKNFKIRQLIHKEHRILYLINKEELIILALPHTKYLFDEAIFYIISYINEL